MVFDILLIVIVVLCAVFGFRSGFLISLSRIGGWVGALVIAFFYADEVEAWTIEHTKWFERLGEHTLRVCHSFIDQYASGLADKLPDGLGDFIEHTGDMLASASAQEITERAFPILVFVGIIFAIKIVLFVLTLLLSKRFHGGFIGGVDSFVGLLFGLFQSIIAILVIFALIMPLSYTLSTEAYFFVQQQMGDSVVAQIIYNNNPLLDFINGFIPSDLNPENWMDAGSEGFVL